MYKKIKETRDGRGGPGAGQAGCCVQVHFKKEGGVVKTREEKRRVPN